MHPTRFRAYFRSTRSLIAGLTALAAVPASAPALLAQAATPPAAATTPAAAPVDPRLEKLKAEALVMVESRAKQVQEIVDMLFSFQELGFQEFEGLALNEAPLAAEVAARYGARHIVRTVDRAEFERDLPAMMDAMDLPTVDGINTWFVAKAAHEAGIKVALSGLGADECFGGYPSFTDVPRSVHWLRPVSWLPGLGALARWGVSRAIAAGLPLHPKTAGVLQYGGTWAGAYLLRRGLYMPWELEDVLDPALVQEGLRRLAPLSRIAEAIQTGRPLGDFDRVAALETSLYMRNQLLRDADWAGMSHGVEIRVPFVDPFFLAALPPGAVLAGMNAKDAIAGVPDPPLPESVRHRRKTGFSTPHGRWLQEAAGAPRQPGIDLSAASRAWALKVWRAGWTGPAAA